MTVGFTCYWTTDLLVWDKTAGYSWQFLNKWGHRILPQSKHSSISPTPIHINTFQFHPHSLPPSHLYPATTRLGAQTYSVCEFVEHILHQWSPLQKWCKAWSALQVCIKQHRSRRRAGKGCDGAGKIGAGSKDGAGKIGPRREANGKETLGYLMVHSPQKEYEYSVFIMCILPFLMYVSACLVWALDRHDSYRYSSVS